MSILNTEHSGGFRKYKKSLNPLPRTGWRQV
jgi:hypothetical protein